MHLIKCELHIEESVKVGTVRRHRWKVATQGRGGGRVRSPSGPSALVALNLRPHCKTGRLGDATLPVPIELEV
jgi:hypothetical protein